MSSRRPGDGVGCSEPVDAAVLADYWAAAIPADEEAAIEEHLFGCDECGRRLREIVALTSEIRQVVREGSLNMVVSDAFLQRAAEDGLRIRQYAPPPGGSVPCTVTAEDDVLVGRLAVDLSGVTRVDLSWSDGRGVERRRVEDIPFRADADAIVVQESITFAKAAPSYTAIARLVAVDDMGHERLLGEYTFNHTRSLPGPGSWLA